MTTRRVLRNLAVVLAVSVAPALAQAPAAQPAPKAAPGAPAAPANASPKAVKPDLPSPPPNYEYQPQGRRDPFVSLVNRGNEGKAATGAVTAKRAEGLPGLLTSEITVRGIVLARGQYVAMVAGPDKKVYTVHAGDKLADGVIRSVTAAAVVILQEVNDPLSLEKQREVRKLLRGGEEVK